MKRITIIALLMSAHCSFAMDKKLNALYRLEKELFENAPENNHTAVTQPAQQTRKETYVHFRTDIDGTLLTINLMNYEAIYRVQQETSQATNQQMPTQPVTPTQSVAPALPASPTQPISPTPSTLSSPQIVVAQAAIDANNNNNNAQKSPIGSIASPIKKGSSYKKKASVPTPSTSPIVLPSGCYLITNLGHYACFFCKTQLSLNNLKDHNCRMVTQIGSQAHGANNNP